MPTLLSDGNPGSCQLLYVMGRKAIHVMGRKALLCGPEGHGLERRMCVISILTDSYDYVMLVTG